MLGGVRSREYRKNRGLKSEERKSGESFGKNHYFDLRKKTDRKTSIETSHKTQYQKTEKVYEISFNLTKKAESSAFTWFLQQFLQSDSEPQ